MPMAKYRAAELHCRNTQSYGSVPAYSTRRDCFRERIAVVVTAGYDISCRLDGIFAVLHRNAHTCSLKHADIVMVIAESDDIGHVDTFSLRPFLQFPALAVTLAGDIQSIEP